MRTTHSIRTALRLAPWLSPLSSASGATIALATLLVSSQPQTGQAAVLFSPLTKADQSLEFAAGADAGVDAGAWLVIDAGFRLGCVIDSPSASNPNASDAPQ